MEDGNVLAADCIVLCCCCQCMILQILIFVLLKLPHKLLRKAKEYAKRLRARKRGTKTKQKDMPETAEDSFRSLESLQVGCCMSEIESVLDEFSRRGEFAFGSFWGAEASSSRSFHYCVRHDQLDYEVVGYI